jgi:tetratricopeptide (TPR) repeat protein
VGETTQGRLTADGALSDPDIEPEILLDVPVQARALGKLSPRERGRYRRARTLLAAGGVREIPRAGMCVAGRGVYEALLAQSWSVRFDDPDEMVRLSEIALDVAQRFTGGSQRLVADLQARAWGELANAYRAADRLRAAQLAFGEAYALLQRGTGDPYLKARLFDLEASLLGTLRELPMALHRLSSLANLYLDLGETHLAGRALITNALYTFYDGNAEEAIEINQRGTSLIDRSKDPALFMFSVHNHLLFLVDLKLYPKALRLLFDSRRDLIYKDRVNALRLRWVEGRINYGLGSLISAETAFREAKEGFSTAGMSFHSALLALELAMVLMGLNRTEEALDEVIAAREIFLSFEIYREYLGSVIFLEEAFRREEATAELIEATVAQINRKWLQVGPRQMR